MMEDSLFSIVESRFQHQMWRRNWSCYKGITSVLVFIGKTWGEMEAASIKKNNGVLSQGRKPWFSRQQNVHCFQAELICSGSSREPLFLPELKGLRKAAPYKRQACGGGGGQQRIWRVPEMPGCRVLARLPGAPAFLPTSLHPTWTTVPMRRLSSYSNTEAKPFWNLLFQ